VTDPGCGSDHCVTCSDEGVPMRVVAVEPDGIACCVDEAGATVDVMTELVADVKTGDRLLVHAGVALAPVAESPEDFRR
jgi:hydrogenase maturation factor